ncbi:MAG TPA: bifunctional phosphoribosyl-AMP cyclohydrolase/phosphoribosyl-ATP diphosphatase HisIE [Cyclobacteriaceae bacterium]
MLDFEKHNGLIPAVIQDAGSNKVLMVGFMNKEAYRKTTESGLVTFYSRSRQALWVKGETSGNYLHVSEVLPDCDQDTLLIKAMPDGPVCHTGTDTCFNEKNDAPDLKFLSKLTGIIKERKDNPSTSSYTTSLFQKGKNKIAQKVGEEAVELVIEAMDNDDERFLEEAADLLFHLMILLENRNFSLQHVNEILEKRHN